MMEALVCHPLGRSSSQDEPSMACIQLLTVRLRHNQGPNAALKASTRSRGTSVPGFLSIELEMEVLYDERQLLTRLSNRRLAVASFAPELKS
jgi:hypothetical protein